MAPIEQASAWWEGLTRRGRVLLSIVTGMVTMLGLVTGVPAAWNTLGLPRVASEEHVKGRLEDLKRDVTRSITAISRDTTELKTRGIETDLRINDLNRSILIRERREIDLFLKLNQGADARLRVEKEQSLREIDQSISELDSDIRNLRRRDRQ